MRRPDCSFRAVETVTKGHSESLSGFHFVPEARNLFKAGDVSNFEAFLLSTPVGPFFDDVTSDVESFSPSSSAAAFNGG